MFTPCPINLFQWINTHREQLRPPVCNQVVWQDTDFIIMVVGGPNQRSDYHVNQTEEFFFQIEGNMELALMLDGESQTVKINEGEIFLLPPTIPHLPKRFKNTVGMVVERKRPAEMKDGFQWYCSHCHHLIYEEYAHIHDIVKQLPEIFEHFYQNPDFAKCPVCQKAVDAHELGAKHDF